MRDESIIYPQVDPNAWAKRYDLNVRPHTCRNCGKELLPTIPFATGKWRGLIAESHACGPNFDYSIIVKSTSQERQEYKNYFEIVRDSLEVPR